MKALAGSACSRAGQQALAQQRGMQQQSAPRVVSSSPPCAAAAGPRRRAAATRRGPGPAAAAAGFPAPSSSSSGGHHDSSSHALAVYRLPVASAASALLPALHQPAPSAPPARRWTTHMWFEAMVQTVVKQLDGGAFLLRVSFNPALSLQLVRRQPADLAAGWDHIQQRHLPAGPHADEAVILVHPVASEEQPCLVQQVAGEACPGCPHTGGAQQQQHPAAAAIVAAAAADAAAWGGGVMAAYAAGTQPSAATELLHGKFGDCCSGDGSEHDHHHHHDAHSSSSCGSPAAGQQQPDTLTAYYGLVVQTREVADPLQGCYLLKTVKQSSSSAAGSSSSSSPCHCTHYSLNKVCKGPTLQQQYTASWLA